MSRYGLPIIASLFVAMASLLVYGCGGRDTEVTPMLDRAEAVMDAHPDSALVLLDSVEGSATLHGLMNEADRARYALLLTQARHKNYIDETSDSLITTAVDYYDRHSSAEPFRLMLSRYYQGVVRSNSRNYASAIISLMKAEALAEHLDQPLWLGRSRVAIGNIYNDVHSPKEEVKYIEKAREAFCQANDSANIWQADESLIIAFNNAKRYKDALSLANKRYDLAASKGDTMSMSRSLEHIGYSLQHLNRHQEAVAAFRNFQALSPEMTNNNYYYLSTALWNAGLHDQSKALIDSIRQKFGDNANVHPEILYDLGMVDEAYRQQKADFSEANDFVGDILNQNVSATVSQYYNDEIAAQEARLRQNRIIATIIVIGVTIIVILIVGFLYYKISVTRREKLKKELEIIDLAKELGSLNIKLSETTDSLTSSNARLDALSSQSSVLLSEKSRIENEKLNAVSLLCEIYHSANSDNSGKSQKVNEAL
ncbi:MAG: hypothetical protein J6A20_07200, partial [Muribaculaceae bacterium]|nr:hypothetical protein [Muribaculaceae bacterium]